MAAEVICIIAGGILGIGLAQEEFVVSENVLKADRLDLIFLNYSTTTISKIWNNSY